ncbi:MAG: U32 family peptidase [Firmicutes bacterium]|nr:U32 family peptidase [Bacillota bacterium]
MTELLAPAGDLFKLKTAIHFGADAVYLAGKQFGLRAFCANFDNEDLKQAVDYVRLHNKKIYVTINIFAQNSDFDELKEYIKYLEQLRVDAVIVSDPGVVHFIKAHAPDLSIHLSTQANTTNKYSAQFWAQYVDRIILARELSIDEIREIKEFNSNLELECFVHGAMCISYSGRCLLSDFMSHQKGKLFRQGNRGECVQACRWSYEFRGEAENGYIIEEDERGSYILNSKDLMMIQHLDKLKDAGVSSFKIEGRAKSQFYVGAVVNAYRRAMDKGIKSELIESLKLLSNREYTTGFYFNERQSQTQNYVSSRAVGNADFMAVVIDKLKDGIIVEQRNRFKKGDILKIISPSNINNKEINIDKMFAQNKKLERQEIDDAKNVQEKIFIPTELDILVGDLFYR